MEYTDNVKKYLASLPEDQRDDIQTLFAAYIKYCDNEEAAQKNLDDMVTSGRMDYELETGSFDEEVQQLWDKNYARGVVPGKDGIFITWSQCVRMINLNDRDQARAFRHIFHEQEDNGLNGEVVREIDRYIDETFPNGYVDEDEDEGDGSLGSD